MSSSVRFFSLSARGDVTDGSSGLLDSKRVLELILQGYDTQSKMQESMTLLYASLRNPQLPFLEISVCVSLFCPSLLPLSLLTQSLLQSILAVLESRMPAKLFKQMQEIIKAQPTQFPTAQLQAAVDQQLSQFEKPADKTTFLQSIPPITELLERYRNGIDGHERNVIASLFRTYLNVEKVTFPSLFLPLCSAKQTQPLFFSFASSLTSRESAMR